YTAHMMAIVAPKAKEHGYITDSIVTSENVPAGRPFPWMCYKNAMNLGVYPMNHIIKVGDTISDIQEGINAGCWTVGVLKGSSSIALKESQVKTLPQNVSAEKMNEITEKFIEAGAQYVVDSIGEVDQLIPKINKRLI